MAEKKCGMALRVRPPAFGLPTGCPRCLPWYFYLRLANVSFRAEYSAATPDSEDLPIAECGPLTGFSSEPGGVEEFLRKENLCDLDKDLTELERSELTAFKSLIACLNDALNFELWCKDNERIVDQIYLSQLPWPINKAIEWNMRRKVMTRLGINKDNAKDREAEIYRRAFHAYEALSSKLQTNPFLLSVSPTSVDAMLLAHLLFLFSVPLDSLLKEELNAKHPHLVRYADSNRDDLLKSSGVSTDLPSSPRAPPSASSSGYKSTRGSETKRKQTPKEKEFKKRGKMFVLAQLAVVAGYLLFSGLTYEEDEGDEEDDEDDD